MLDIRTPHRKQTNSALLMASLGFLAGTTVPAYVQAVPDTDVGSAEPEALYKPALHSLTSGSIATVVAATPDTLLEAAVQHVYAEITQRQQPLGREFEQILFASLSDLYIED